MCYNPHYKSICINCHDIHNIEYIILCTGLLQLSWQLKNEATAFFYVSIFFCINCFKIFAQNFPNIQPIFNPIEVLESWDLGLPNCMILNQMEIFICTKFAVDLRVIVHQIVVYMYTQVDILVMTPEVLGSWCYIFPLFHFSWNI